MKATTTALHRAITLGRHMVAGAGVGLRLLVLVTVDHALDTPDHWY